MNLIEYFKNKSLLSNGRNNTKIAKNNILTYGLSLLPHSLNSKGENLCKFSTKECREMCLNYSGRGIFNSIQLARLRKADFFVMHKSIFINKLYKELERINKKNKKCLVRLNVISDVDWINEFEKENYDIGKFNNILFYNYTKNPFYIENNKLENQHFTFSYSGGNWFWCKKFLTERKANVAVVFKNKLPLTWRGFKVIDGDLNDERVSDERGVIIGLKYKVVKGKPYQKNKFIVDE